MDLAKLLVSDSFAWSCPYYAVPVLWGQFAALSLGVLYCLAYSDASLIFTYFPWNLLGKQQWQQLFWIGRLVNTTQDSTYHVVRWSSTWLADNTKPNELQIALSSRENLLGKLHHHGISRMQEFPCQPPRIIINDLHVSYRNILIMNWRRQDKTRTYWRF